MFPRLARRTRVATLSILAVAALGLTACTGGGGGGAAGTADSLDGALAGSIDEAVASAMTLSGSTEAIIGVWDADGNSYVRSYGDNESLDGNSLIRGAQATQPVMCALLLDLVDAGTVNLDDLVTEDLSRQVGIEDITYAQLCDQRSGLADFKKGYVDIFVNNPARTWPDKELISQGLVGSPLKWAGLNFNQSDTNAVLLSRALRVKTGAEADDLLQEHVFSKAGMTSSYFPTMADNELVSSSMTGLTYPASGGAPVCDVEPITLTSMNPSMLAGAGATVTTVNDLKKFYEAYIGGVYGGDENSAIVTDTFSVKNPERDADGNPTEEIDESGRQWSFGVEKLGSLYGRSGAITGTLTAAYHDPSTGYSVVVSLNNSSAGAGFIKALALELAALSTDAGVGPEITWTAAEQAEALQKAAVCQ